ncbi:EamA family transporter [Halobacteriales archaeon SW_7_65_23]|nr:MAG: EamA family transporter [Halobacteriales archaeon SW_7_65_23]
MNREAVGVVMVIAAAAGFGTLAIFGKFAEAAGVNTMTLLTFRFLVGTVLLWLVLALWGRAHLLSGRNLRVALALGVVYAGFSLLFFWGLLYVTAGVAGVVFYTYPAVVYLLSVAFLDERVSVRKLAALVCAFTGVALVAGGDAAGIDLLGVVLVLLAGWGYAVYITGNRAVVASLEADILAGTALVATTLVTAVFGIASGQLVVPTTVEQWWPILGTAVLGTSLPLVLYVGGLDRIEASRAAITSTVEPVVTVLLGIIILDEAFTLSLVGGGVLVLGGVLLIQTDPRALLDSG